MGSKPKIGLLIIYLTMGLAILLFERIKFMKPIKAP
jgi:hypothetical protein